MKKMRDTEFKEASSIDNKAYFRLLCEILDSVNHELTHTK